MNRTTLTLLAVIVVGLVGFSFLSCTEQQQAKNFGGSMTVKIQTGHKLVTATWKNNDLWYLTRPMRIGESAEEYKFKEKSNFGLMEGTVVFKETER